MTDVAGVLNEHFRKKQKVNPSLSVRFLAKELSISPAQMSMLLNGQRQVSLRILPRIAQILDIDHEVEDSLRLTILKNSHGEIKAQDMAFTDTRQTTPAPISTPQETPILAEEDQFIALNSWHYFAILQTTLLAAYDGTPQFISSFLGIPLDDVEKFVGELLSARLLVQDETTGHLKKSQSNMQYRSRKRDQLRRHHISNMEKAIETLKSQNTEYNMENRLITSAAFSCRQDQIPLLKQHVQNFIQSMAHTDQSEKHDEVCQLSIQLFPLSRR